MVGVTLGHTKNELLSVLDIASLSFLVILSVLDIASLSFSETTKRQCLKHPRVHSSYDQVLPP